MADLTVRFMSVFGPEVCGLCYPYAQLPRSCCALMNGQQGPDVNGRRDDNALIRSAVFEE